MNEESGIALDDFDELVQGVLLYRQIYKEEAIPVKFEVPAESPWPISMHGLRLGKRLEKLLSTEEFFDQHQDKAEQLLKLGFDMNGGPLLLDDWDILFLTLKTFHKIHGNLKVNVKYIVPSSNIKN
jgi:hypothetical protein